MKRIVRRLALLIGFAFLLGIFSQALADPYCPYCGIYSNYSNHPMPYHPGYSHPNTGYAFGPTYSFSQPNFYSNNSWWTRYGAMSYPNFYYPGAWQQGGMNGGSYPHHGSGFMGKPNVYISGKAGTNIHIQVKMAADSFWLAAVPIHGTKGWQGTLTEDGRIQVSEKESHSYFFYDFRCDESKLQDIAGFCTKRENIIQKLAAILKQKGFHSNEVSDFENYWSVKLPPSENYCVYPQESPDLNKLSEIQVKPEAKKIIRIAFMIIPEEARKTKSSNNKFLKPPRKPWVSTEQSSSSKDDLEIREWGVGFIQAPMN